MKTFPDAVAASQAKLDFDPGTHEGDPARVEQAAAVQPCVERFVFGEMDSTRNWSASRNPLPGCPPSLAEKLGDRLSTSNKEAAENAVVDGLAFGWTAYVGLE